MSDNTTPRPDAAKLRECPFCGFIDDDPICRDKHGEHYCPNCGASGPWHPEAWGQTTEEISDNTDVLWNRRAPSPVEVELREALAKALRAAVAAIYFDDSSDFSCALWDVVKAIDPSAADLLEEASGEAYAKYCEAALAKGGAV